MPAKVTVTIIKGKLQGRQFYFNSRTTCIIGRAKDCNIQIPNDQYHSTISRYHCLLDINPPDIRIRDFGSLHGTFINGQCIGKRRDNQTPKEGAKLNFSEYNLQDEDLIKLGNTVFKVSIESIIEVPLTFNIEEELNKIPPSIVIKADSNLGSFKDYKKIQKLGEGGCGEVYLARHNLTEELVAIKTFLPQVIVKPYMKDMFLREVRITKMLNHPNLVELKDYSFSDGVFFFAMEYCDHAMPRFARSRFDNRFN